MPENIFIYKA